MANTPGFGWETPDDTDLVKDGAAAMRTLGNAIDASLVDLKGGTTNQILAKNSNTDMDFKWVANDVGDITAVTAGTGLSGGGTSGDVTLTNTVATTFDAKGDLVVGTGADTFAKLVAGSNGETLVADSSTTTGLRWQGNFAAGKNKILNGAMDIWQRGTSLSNAGFVFGADQWRSFSYSGSSSTISRQTFTPGTAPVSGYESQYFLRLRSTNTQTLLFQNIEDVRTLAGQTATVSFWVKSSSSVTLGASIVQNFGSGGSADVTTSLTLNPTNQSSPSWARVSATVTVPSVSGKTIGASSYLQLNIFTTSINVDFDIWGVQLEIGNTATAFQTATGTLAGELAACQRYYYRTAGLNNGIFGQGLASSTTTGVMQVPLPVTMRVKPTSIDSSSLYIADGVSAFTGGTVTIGAAERGLGVLNYATTGLTQFRPYYLSMTSDSGYVGFSAEL